jgi:hypothetical protein
MMGQLAVARIAIDEVVAAVVGARTKTVWRSVVVGVPLLTAAIRRLRGEDFWLTAWNRSERRSPRESIPVAA